MSKNYVINIIVITLSIFPLYYVFMENNEQTSDDRSLEMSAADLILHLEDKLSGLLYLQAWHGLSDEVIESLRQHIQEEIDFLRAVSPEVTIEALIENHFVQNIEFKETIKENRNEEKINLDFKKDEEESC